MMNLPEAGDVIDETYEIRSVLGKGGFGAVYLARQINMDRDVALKLLVASGPKFEEMVKRFRREVMAIRNLTHPNTIRVYDFRDNPEGLLYYTMEALKGRNLKEEVTAFGPLSPRRLKRVLRQVLKSLSEAHSHGLVHRDLKPANIMIVEMHGETDFVKVLDFGIAKMMADAGEEGEEGDNLTSAGILVGTLRYMAPEQISAEYLGPQTDLYALGLIAVEMLTGSSVFAGTGRWEVLRKQISEDPVPMPRAVQESALGPVIARCLQKDYRARFANAAEVIQALDGIGEEMLEEQPLFVSDGQGGWVPRVEEGDATRQITVPAKNPDLDGMDTIVVDISERIPQPDEVGGEKTMITPGPTMAGSSGGQEMGLVERQTSEVTGSVGFANQGFGAGTETDVTGTMVATEKKSSLPLVIVLVAIALLFGMGAIYFLTREAPEKGGLETEAMVGAVDEGRENGADASDEAGGREEIGEEGRDEVEVRTVEIRTPGARARVFVEEELRGRTPYTLRLSDASSVAVRLEATGYEDEVLEIDGGSPEQMEVELVREVRQEEEVARDEGRSEPARTSQSGGGGESDRGGAAEREVEEPASRPTREVRREEPAPEEPEESDDSSSGWFEVEEEPQEEETEIDLW